MGKTKTDPEGIDSDRQHLSGGIYFHLITLSHSFFVTISACDGTLL